MPLPGALACRVAVTVTPWPGKVELDGVAPALAVQVRKLPWPLCAAVRVRAATLSDDVCHTAWPEAAIARTARVVSASLDVTLPPGVPAASPVAVTPTARATSCPKAGVA